MKMRLTLLLIVFGLLLESCAKLNSKEIIVDVDKEFSVQPWERLDEFGGGLQLNVATLKNEECGGTSINHDARTIGNKVKVTLLNLTYPVNCSTVAPARDTIKMPATQTNTTYDLEINLKDVVTNAGKLKVEDGKYTVTMTNENGIVMPSKQVLRVPQNAFWGIIANDAGNDKIATQMLDSLKTIATPISMANGDYGYFNVDNGKLTVKTEAVLTKQSQQAVLFRLNNKAALPNVVQNFRATGLEMWLLTSEGKVFTK
ncbi:MAG: hypothetical protein U5L45_03070 [Saprospiraceae bacterium]|nr:hypothetical protein [Saprospiraceae bacterium]